MFRSQYHRIIGHVLIFSLIQSCDIEASFAESCRQDKACHEAALRAELAMSSEQRQSSIVELLSFVARINDPRITAVIGRLYLKERQYVEALKFCNQARVRAPDDEELQEKTRECIDVSNREVNALRASASASADKEGFSGNAVPTIRSVSGVSKRRRSNSTKSQLADQYRVDQYQQSSPEQHVFQPQVQFSDSIIDSNRREEDKTLPANGSRSLNARTIATGISCGVLVVGLAIGVSLGIYGTEPKLSGVWIVPINPAR